MTPVAVSSVLFKKKLFNLMFLSTTNSVSFYSSLSGQQQPISLPEFSFSLFPNRDIRCATMKVPPVELQGIVQFSTSPTQTGWLCASRSRGGSLCPSAPLTLVHSTPGGEGDQALPSISSCDPQHRKLNHTAAVRSAHWDICKRRNTTLTQPQRCLPLLTGTRG